MPGKRNNAQKADHRKRIAEMRLKGHTIREIIAATRISESTVHRTIRALAAEWKASAAETIDAHKELELAKLEAIEKAAWKEYERSRKDYSKETTERFKFPGKGQDGGDLITEPTVTKRETGGRLGDPKFLQIALNAGEARRKMLGMDAPTKIAPTDPTGTKPYEKMSDDEIDARIRELQAKDAQAA